MALPPTPPPSSSTVPVWPGESITGQASPPLAGEPIPPHYVIGDDWQTSYYDSNSPAPLGVYVKIPSGEVDLTTGRRTGEDFPSTGMWKQV
jgi:hypothetical protein